jgi:hypothetical protein
MIGTAFRASIAAFVIILSIATVFVVAYVWISLRWQRREREQQSGIDPLAFHHAGWDYVVDGKPIARLTWAGQPEDPNMNFVPFDVSIEAGHEAEVASLLYRSNHRNPDDARVRYHSLGSDRLVLVDSQVYVGHGNGSRVTLKVYPKANEPTVA